MKTEYNLQNIKGDLSLNDAIIILFYMAAARDIRRTDLADNI